jgi:hypothetical protein
MAPSVGSDGKWSSVAGRKPKDRAMVCCTKPSCMSNEASMCPAGRVGIEVLKLGIEVLKLGLEVLKLGLAVS